MKIVVLACGQLANHFRRDAAHLGVDSLAYLTKDGMVEAAQANASHFCTACFDGAYPIAMDESGSGIKLMLEPRGIASQLEKQT